MTLFIIIGGGLALAVLGLVTIAVGLFSSRPHEISITAALGWSAFWVA